MRSVHVLRVTGNSDAADELVQDIWLRVLQGIGRLRERYAAPISEGADPDALAADPIDLDLAFDIRELEHGLQHLPPLEREVLSLFYLGELALAEVAQVLAVPIGTVKSRLFRARKLLRQQLAGESHD